MLCLFINKCQLTPTLKTYYGKTTLTVSVWNIKNKHLSRKGLHLNGSGSELLARSFLEEIKLFWVDKGCWSIIRDKEPGYLLKDACYDNSSGKTGHKKKHIVKDKGFGEPLNDLREKNISQHVVEVERFARCSSLVTFCSLLVPFCSLLVVFCSLRVTFCSLLVAICSLLATFCSLLVTFCCCLLLFARCSLLFTRCLLSFARCALLFARRSLLFPRCSLLFCPSYVLKV